MKTVRPRGKTVAKRRPAKTAASPDTVPAQLKARTAMARGELLPSRRSEPSEKRLPEPPAVTVGLGRAPAERWIRRCDDGGAMPALTPEGVGLLKTWILLHPAIPDEAVLELERVAGDLSKVVALVLEKLHPSDALRDLWRTRRQKVGKASAVLEEEGAFLLTQIELELPEWIGFWQSHRAQLVLH